MEPVQLIVPSEETKRVGLFGRVSYPGSNIYRIEGGKHSDYRVYEFRRRLRKPSIVTIDEGLVMILGGGFGLPQLYERHSRKQHKRVMYYALLAFYNALEARDKECIGQNFKGQKYWKDGVRLCFRWFRKGKPELNRAQAEQVRLVRRYTEGLGL